MYNYCDLFNHSTVVEPSVLAIVFVQDDRENCEIVIWSDIENGSKKDFSATLYIHFHMEVI